MVPKRGIYCLEQCSLNLNAHMSHPGILLKSDSVLWDRAVLLTSPAADSEVTGVEGVSGGP